MMQGHLFAQETWEKIERKMCAVVPRTLGKLPYTPINGRYNDLSRENPNWWTNGFWPGMMWMLYMRTNNEMYREAAENAEELLDSAFMNYDGINHDLGFLWHLSSGENYRLTGNPKARLRATYAANLMVGRFNLNGQYIRAWLPDETIGWSIIDAMMNLPLLYWASNEYHDPRFQMIAQAHADMTMRDHLRADGSVRHIVNHDYLLGGVIDEKGGQGYAVGTSWSRGQAWAIYGFALTYRYLQKREYLDAAKRVAHYFIASVCDDWLPRCDLRSPAEPVIYDSTAGAIAACGFLEIEAWVDELEKPLYRRAALSILRAMTDKWCNWNPDEDAILGMGTERYHNPKTQHIPIIYGDFFLMDAIGKLLGMPSIW